MLETIVIGAGIAGFSAALALRDRGAAVTVLDMGRPGGAATGAAAGLLAAQYEPAPAVLRLRLASRAFYPEFVSQVEEFSRHDLDLRWNGMLVANFSAAEHEESARSAAWQRQEGAVAEILDPGEAGELQGGLATDVLSYLWLPDEGQLDSQILALALGEAIARTEIRLIAGGAASIVSQDGVVTGVVMRDGRSLSADRVIVAAGAWSAAIGGLPRRIPIRPVRGQMLRYPSGSLELSRSVASHAGQYLVPRSDGSVLAGSTMEEVGFDRSVTEEGLSAIHVGVSRLVPAIAALKAIERWAGLRPISADGLPVIGPDPELEGLIYATGYGRSGILLGPLGGAIAAELAVSGRSGYDWTPFRADRFVEGPEAVG